MIYRLNRSQTAVGPTALLLALIAADPTVRLWSHLVSGDVSFFRQVPGRILAGLGNLGSLMWQADRGVVTHLTGGNESMAATAATALAKIV